MLFEVSTGWLVQSGKNIWVFMPDCISGVKDQDYLITFSHAII
jgi:hypothetical protein